MKFLARDFAHPDHGMIENGRFPIGTARLLFGAKTTPQSISFFAVKTGRDFSFPTVFPSAPQNAAYDAELPPLFESMVFVSYLLKDFVLPE